MAERCTPVTAAWVAGAETVLLRFKKGLPVVWPETIELRKGLDPVVIDDNPLDVVLCILSGVDGLLRLLMPEDGVPKPVLKGCCCC